MAISDLKGSINAKIKTNGSQSITGAVLNEVLNEMVDELDVTSEINNKVDKGDYAPALTAGFADNLVSKDVVVDSEFNLRRSGGGAISDGVARMEVVKGNSVVRNQRFERVDMVSNGVTSTYLGEGVYELSGSATESYFNVIAVKNIIVGHQYLLMAKLLTNPNNIASMRFEDLNDSSAPKVTMPANSYAFGLASISRNTHSFGLVGFGGAGVDFTGVKIKVTLYDLTQMFGAGNEPTTIEEYYARKPIVEDEYAYNEGEVIHCNVDAVKSVGRNVWDEEWEVGAYNSLGNKVNLSDRIRSKNFIPVLPNTTYSKNKNLQLYYYDADKNYIGWESVGNTATFTTESNVHYIAFNAFANTGTTYNHDICINISDPDFNGQYEPYKEDVRELPSAIKEVFPNGMMSAGTAHDVAYNDLNKEVGVTEKRIGVVDMGTLDWYRGTNGRGKILWKAANLNDMGIATNNNILCNQYVTRTSGEIYWDGLIGINVHDEANGMYFLFLYDPQYDDYDVASFKAAMAGVQLYYELATPIVTEHQEPFNLDYQVTNGGQEQAMATEPTSAFKAEIAYGFNAAAKIKENANEIASLKATIAQLQAALASMVNENVEDYE